MQTGEARGARDRHRDAERRLAASRLLDERELSAPQSMLCARPLMRRLKSGSPLFFVGVVVLAALAGLPLVGLLLGQALGARPWAVLTGTVLGQGLLVVGAVLVAAGLEWSAHLTARVVR